MITFKGSVDDGKTIAEELQTIIGMGHDLSTELSDFMYQLECDYQSHYGLATDNWERVGE